jgi:glycosyl hydrolase family 2
MVYPHRIRLRGPWECEPITTPSPTPLPAARRVTVLGNMRDFGLAGFSGQVRVVRKFGYPGRIDEHERVWLTCDGLEGRAAIRLNDQLMAKEHSGPFAFDVTQLLRPHNRLEITLDAESDQVGVGEVALEIRCTAYLSEMSARRLADGALDVTGKVVGFCDGPLEVYAILDGAQVHYERVEATAEGRAVRFGIAARANARQLRLELVNVSTVWFAWDCLLT